MTAERLTRPLAIGLVAVLVLGCSSSADPSASATSNPSSSSSAGAAASFPPLPTGTLTNGVEIGQALLDPTRAADGVMSLLTQLGVEIQTLDGSVLVPGQDAAHGLYLIDGEVHGLIALATADAQEIANGGVPAQVGDLTAGLAPLVPDLSGDEILAAYATAYTAAPDELVPQVLAGLHFEPDAVASRAQLWLLLVDGFVLPALAEAESASAMTASLGPRPPVTRWRHTSGLMLVPIASPDPLVDARDFAYFLAQLQLIGMMIPFSVVPSSATAHEGHGGPGSPVEFQARYVPAPIPINSPRTGQPLVVPAPIRLSGLPVTWRSLTESVLNAHGSLDPGVGTTVATDGTGFAAVTYRPKAEDGDHTGEVLTDSAILTAEVPLVDLLAANYVIYPAVRGLIWGQRMEFASLRLEWHAEGSYLIDGARNGGQVHGQKCGGLDGEWIVDGTYTRMGFDGTQRWTITLDEASMTGSFTYTDHQVGVQVGVTITTEGQAEGTVTATVEDDGGPVHMHLAETHHTFHSTTSVGGTGSDQNAPLANYDFDWQPAPAC